VLTCKTRYSFYQARLCLCLRTAGIFATYVHS